LKIGKHNGGQPISTPEERKPFGAVATDGSEAFSLRNVLPGIGGCLHGASCTYDNTADEDFIIDTLPGQPDTLLITGLSGHGFKFAPVLVNLPHSLRLKNPLGLIYPLFTGAL
jgi:N-methyl-L-tryptophan oxidase